MKNVFANVGEIPPESIQGPVTVGECAYFGQGSLVREMVLIGAGAVIGMGSVVLRDVPPGEVWAGVPARSIRHRRNL
jgi:acetyltransferase-like isoleucine patch superfamily enzyme